MLIHPTKPTRLKAYDCGNRDRFQAVPGNTKHDMDQLSLCENSVFPGLRHSNRWSLMMPTTARAALVVGSTSLTVNQHCLFAEENGQYFNSFDFEWIAI